MNEEEKTEFKEKFRKPKKLNEFDMNPENAIQIKDGRPYHPKYCEFKRSYKVK